MLQWQTNNRPSANGEIGYLGRIYAFDFCYDSDSKNHPNLPYTVTCRLPGFKYPSLRAHDDEHAKKLAEMMLKMWLFWTGLKAADSDPAGK